MTNEPSLSRRAFLILRLLLDSPAEQREALLDARCGSDVELRREVESLLEQDRRSWSALERPPALSSLNPEDHDAEADPPPPEQIGRYRIVEQVGEGAMGVVYRAEQDHPKRQVALKLIRPGRHSRALVRRFMREATTLGRLRHPGIAQIYDAGSKRVGGVEHPYLAMEFIEGPGLREYVRARRLDVRARLRLVIRICEAVQHAHQQGVIHRDLKPDNILVEHTAEAPRPRVLDFGVARLIDADGPAATLATEAGQLMGTLPYMSPEQVEGQPADTRMDVYALGVILYELLTGRLPIDVRNDTLLTALKRIREEPPQPLRQLAPALRGDLEIIVATALEKDPQRRYASAGELAADLRRYLACEPIQARKAGAMYRLAMFARRRRGLASAALLVMLTAVGGAAWGLHGLTQANRALDDLSGISTFLVADVVIALDRIAGTTEVRRRLLSRLETQVEALLARRPRDRPLLLTHAELLVRLSDIDREEGRYAESLALRERALALRDLAAEIGGRDAEFEADYALHLVKIGDIYNGWGERFIAREWYERARRIHERLVVEHPHVQRYMEDLSWSYHRLAQLATIFGPLDEVESLLWRRFELVERMLADGPDDEAMVLHTLRAAHASLALFFNNYRFDLDRALRHDAQALEAARQVVRLAPFKRVYVGDAADTMVQVGERLCRIQDFEAAEALHAEATRIVGSLLADPDSQWTAMWLIKLELLGERIAAGRRDYAKAFDHARRALEIVMQRDDDYYFKGHWLRCLRTCARLAMRLGEYELANAYALEVVAETYSTQATYWNDPDYLRTCAASLTALARKFGDVFDHADLDRMRWASSRASSRVRSRRVNFHSKGWARVW